VAWSRAAKRWGELTNPASRTDPAPVAAASEVRAAIAAAATNPTGWATAEQLASRLDLPDAVKTLHLSMVASVDIAYVARDTAADHPGLTAPARIIGMRAQGEGGDRDRAGGDPVRRRHLDDAQPNRGQAVDPAARAGPAWTDQPRRRCHRRYQPGCRRGRSTRPQRHSPINQAQSSCVSHTLSRIHSGHSRAKSCTKRAMLVSCAQVLAEESIAPARLGTRLLPQSMRKSF
jgi:hypothetical protein